MRTPAKKKTKAKKLSKKKAAKAAAPSRNKAKSTPKKKTKKKTIKKTISVSARAAGSGSKKKSKSSNEDELRRILVAKRNSILKEAGVEISKFIGGDTKQLADNAVDDGDWSFVEMDGGVNLRKLTAQKETLNKVDEALRKLNEGTYGLCEECGDEISKERLTVLPFAILCIECKEQKEREERFEMEAEL